MPDEVTKGREETRKETRLNLHTLEAIMFGLYQT